MTRFRPPLFVMQPASPGEQSPWIGLLLGTCLFVSGSLTLLGLTGCVGSGDVELLEAQLRQQESVIRMYQSKADEVQQELIIAQRELDALHQQLASAGGPIMPQEQTRALAAAEGLTIHTLLTAGQDQDGLPGDDLIHAVLYPHDSHGEIVKLGGELEVEAYQLEGGVPRSLGHWKYDSEQVRNLWHAGFLVSGYQVELPWQTAPQQRQVFLHATLKTVDGRTLEATHTVAIDVPEGIVHRPAESTEIPAADELQVPQPVTMESPASGDPFLSTHAVDRIPTAEAGPAPFSSTSRVSYVSPADFSEPFSAPTRIETRETRDLSGTTWGAATIHPPEQTGTQMNGARRNPKISQRPDDNLGRATLRTSDAWTEQTIPVIR